MTDEQEIEARKMQTARRISDILLLGVAAVTLPSLFAGCSLMSNDMANTSNVRFSRSAAEEDGDVVRDADVFEFPANMANETLEVSLVREYQDAKQGEEILRREQLTIKRSSDPGKIGAGEVALSKSTGTKEVTNNGIATVGTLGAAALTGQAASAAPATSALWRWLSGASSDAPKGS